ncbi:domain found in IF2B/IF5-domain-containing protein [Auriculariales sp. MPI-PUGE-AT-0066]|nr:domain found in IF2B/IF5-domain-containing protein [Auriculariales sp. MPI-PUGE-AT-0066]
MASEEPLFDPSLKKKKKKKTVAFSEDPLGADNDPTTPAPADDNAADDGAPTVHEQMAQHDAEAAAEDPDAMFSGLKKKKKKKDIPMDLEETPATPAASTGDDLDLSDLKKKKKKKEIPMDLVREFSRRNMVIARLILGMQEDQAAPAPAADGAGDDLDFGDLKKKKKKVKKGLDMEAFEKELQDAAEEDEDVPTGEHLEEDGDLGDDPFSRQDSAPAGIDSGAEPWLGSDRDYTYQELLNRFFNALHASNPALLSSAGKRYTIAPPSIHRDGNKKTVFANIADICKRMHRQPEHVIQFLFSEMGTTGSVDGSGRLVIKGRFLQKQVENVLRRYIVEYVTCKTCKSPDTLLTKENRIFFMSCESCGSRRSVAAIKSGFQAQVGRRSKNRTG